MTVGTTPESDYSRRMVVAILCGAPLVRVEVFSLTKQCFAFLFLAQAFLSFIQRELGSLQVLYSSKHEATVQGMDNHFSLCPFYFGL